MTEQKIEQIATASTPLIRNAWYVAATSDEVGSDLMSRWVLERSILLYRTDEGRVVALDNRCPHRSFPLSNGRRVGDNVACGYHGMTFNPEGRCVNYPPIGKAPNVRTRAYPVVERAPLIWVWPGDPALADESRIPDHYPLIEDGWATVSGSTHVKANYVGLQENLQDLSHFEHLHSSSVGTPDQVAADTTVEKRENGVFSTYVYDNIAAPPIWKNLLKLRGDRITRVIKEDSQSPAICQALTTFTDLAKNDSEDRDHRIKVLHFLTPEFQDTTHYFWFFMRDFAIENADVGEQLKVGISSAFDEDKEALENIAELTSLDSRSDFKEMSFLSDKGGVLLRRWFASMAQAEQASAQPINLA